MPYQKIFPPAGLKHESTPLVSGESWRDANNMRFRSGIPEIIGGWERDSSYTLDGVGRRCFSNTDYAGINYQFVGTTWKYYAISGTDAVDITPNRSNAAGTPMTMAAVNGSSLLTVTHSGHGLAINDFVRYTSVNSAVGGFSTDQLTIARGFQVATINSIDEYVIYITDENGTAITSGSSASGSRTVTWYYKVTSGQDAVVGGQGFGSGSFGGEGMPTEYDLVDNPLTTSGTTTNVVIEIDGTEPTPAMANDDQIYLKGLTGTVGGIITDQLNDNWWTINSVADLVSDNDIQISISPYASTSGATGGGSAGKYYRYDASITDPTVDGASRGWNEPSTQSIDVGDTRRVYIDNFGEDLLFANAGGPIYYYDVSVNTSGGLPLSGATNVALKIDSSNFSGSSNPPTVVDSFLISSKDGHCVALGCNDIGGTTLNQSLVRWSDQNNPFDWTPNATNTSGGQVLRSGSKIVGGIATKSEIIVFTDSSVYSMKFIGPPDVFSFTLVTQGVGIVGPNAAANADNAVFLMGNDGFYVYDGRIRSLPCPVASYVFNDLNTDQRGKVFTAVNSAFSEVSWFYPSKGSSECDKYVTFNYSDNVWYYGYYDMKSLKLTTGSTEEPRCRTAWRDAVVFSNPMATYLESYTAPTSTAPELIKTSVYVHDVESLGPDTTNGGTYIKTGDVQISDGNAFSLYSGLVADVQVYDPANVEGSLKVEPTIELTYTLSGRTQPNVSSASIVATTKTFGASTGNYSTTPSQNEMAVRGRDKAVALRVDFATTPSNSCKARLGQTLVDIRPDGRR